MTITKNPHQKLSIYANDIYYTGENSTFDHVEHNENTGATGGIKIDTDGSLIIAFRGTDDIRDLVYNMMRWRTRLFHTFDHEIPSNVEVHSGFLKQTVSIMSKIIGHVDIPPSMCYITGHSLGGAMALIASAHLAVLWPHCVIKVTTFGCPRVGNAAFSSWLYTRSNIVSCSRVIFGRDIVGSLPYFGYTHTGIVYRLPSTFSYVWMISNHSIDAYRRYLCIPNDEHESHQYTNDEKRTKNSRL